MRITLVLLASTYNLFCSGLSDGVSAGAPKVGFENINYKFNKNKQTILLLLLLLSLWSATTFASAISPVNITKVNIKDKEKLGKLT